MAKTMTITLSNGILSRKGAPVELNQRIRLGVGTVEFRRTQDGFVVFRYSGRGNHVYDSPISKDGEWCVGAEKTYRIVTPEEEACPYRAMCRLLRISPEILRFHLKGEEVEFSDSSRNLDSNVRCGRSASLHSDQKFEYQWGSTVKHGGHDTETLWTASVGETASFAVIYGRTSASDFRITSRIFEIHVWEGADPEVLKKFCIEWLYGQNADEEYLEFWGASLPSEDSKPLALDWIRGRMEATEDPQVVRCHESDYRMTGFSWSELRFEKVEPSKRLDAFLNLLKTRSYQEQLELLPTNSREFALALKDRQKAVEWLKSNGRLFKYEESVFSADSKGKLMKIDLGRSGGNVSSLLIAHTGLIDELEIPNLGDPLPTQWKRVPCERTNIPHEITDQFIMCTAESQGVTFYVTDRNVIGWGTDLWRNDSGVCSMEDRLLWMTSAHMPSDAQHPIHEKQGRTSHLMMWKI